MDAGDSVDTSTRAAGGQEEDEALFVKEYLPHLGHFPRSDASIAYALNELDVLLSKEDEDEEDVVIGESKAGPTTPPVHQKQEHPSSSSWCAVESHPVDFCHEYPYVTIVTTASLPWLTGTAVNPALRAAYLCERGHAVTLLVPWIPAEEQKNVFQENKIFENGEDQVREIEKDISNRVPFHVKFWRGGVDECDGPWLRIRLYNGKYAPALGSIIPTQDIQPLVPDKVSLIVLEEPEHLTWYHSGKRWIRAFDAYVPVVGVMHTNYVDYARRMAGEAASITLKKLNTFLCRQHTHKVIKLSAAVQRLPREDVCFVHGVSDAFLKIGEMCQSDGGIVFSKGAYFLGKALWAKGFEELLDRMQEHVTLCGESTDKIVSMDVYGHGKELEEIEYEALRVRGLSNLSFLGSKNHLSDDMAGYRVFVNPSTSDVVATTSAEALAMGKWLLVPRHPCNSFFERFQNCLIYDNDVEFHDLLIHSSSTQPNPLTERELNMLSWTSATERFLLCCSDTNMERSKRLGFERVACKTSWMGYNVGYGVYSVVTKAMESLVASITKKEETRTTKFKIALEESKMSRVQSFALE